LTQQVKFRVLENSRAQSFAFADRL